MARSRLIKPGFFRNEQLCELPHATRLLFAGLWGLADRAGRLEDRPKRIAADVFPYEALDVEAMLDGFAAAGFIVRYVVADARYIEIPTFLQHQAPHLREAPSTIPAPTQAVPSTNLGSAEHLPRQCEGSAKHQPRQCEGSVEHLPRQCEGSVEHLPRSPVSVSVSVSKTVPVTESVAVPVADPVLDPETVPRSSRVFSKPAQKERLTNLAHELRREYPNASQDVLIDTLQWTARQQLKIEIKRHEAIKYLAS